MESWEWSWVSCFFSKQMLWRLLKIFFGQTKASREKSLTETLFWFLWLCVRFRAAVVLNVVLLVVEWRKERPGFYYLQNFIIHHFFFFLHNIYSLISVCLLLFCLLCSLKSFELWENNGTRHICLIPFLFLLAIPKQKRVAGWMKQWKRATCKKILWLKKRGCPCMHTGYSTALLQIIESKDFLFSSKFEV